MIDTTGFEGRQLGRFVLEELIGRGGMSAVYRAYDVALERRVAFKILADHHDMGLTSSNRFIQEAKIVARLQHENIVPIYDFGEARGVYYFVMPLYAEGSLEDLLRQQRPSLDDTANISRQLANALDYAHSQDVIHRDIKASNILLDARGRVLLADFGVAKILNVSSALTLSGRIVGTPSYMAPELWRDEPASPQSDIYALGVLIYRMLSGSLPFEASEPMALMLKHLHTPPEPIHQRVPDLSPEVDDVIEVALAKNPMQRYSTASEFADALEQAVKLNASLDKGPVQQELIPTTNPAVSPPDTSAPTPERPVRDRSGLSKLRIILALCMAGLVVLTPVILTVFKTPTPTPPVALVTPTPFAPAAVTVLDSPSPISTSTPTPIVSAALPTSSVLGPVTPEPTEVRGALSDSTPSMEHQFLLKAGEIFKLCLQSQQFDPVLTLKAPEATPISGVSSSQGVCIAAYQVDTPGVYIVTVAAASVEAVGQYALILTLYDTCATQLPIAVVNSQDENDPQINIHDTPNNLDA